MRRPDLYLKDILDSVNLIEEYIAGMDLEAFKKDVKTADAVIKRFENIGEAAKSIPEDAKARYNEVPWKEMAGMRDKLVHFYFGVKHELVWTAIKNRLPSIKSSIEKMLIDLKDNSIDK